MVSDLSLSSTDEVRFDAYYVKCLSRLSRAVIHLGEVLARLCHHFDAREENKRVVD